MKKQGLFWHVHHDILLEYCYDYDERVRFIKEYKPEHEIETRLRLFQPVKGKLPTEVIKACEACEEAGKAYAKAGKAYVEARKAYDEAREAYNEACKAYDEAREAYAEARKAYGKIIQKHTKKIEALHAQECSDCCWDGTKLVFGG